MSAIQCFASYKEAQNEVVLMGLCSQRDYLLSYKKTSCRLPSNPHLFYSGHWKGWGNFLKTYRSSSRPPLVVSYFEAQKLVLDAGILTSRDYLSVYKSFGVLPSSPSSFYVKHWLGWDSFLSKKYLDN